MLLHWLHLIGDVYNITKYKLSCLVNHGLNGWWIINVNGSGTYQRLIYLCGSIHKVRRENRQQTVGTTAG